jgi:hypothetical protein
MYDYVVQRSPDCHPQHGPPAAIDDKDFMDFRNCEMIIYRRVVDGVLGRVAF